MSRSKVEGTKIAQAAKDLNVTSVTIRRYIQEFNIETATDENGIKVLPKRALDELQEIRKLKEDGLTNPKVMEHLEEMREKGSDEPEESGKAEKSEKKALKILINKLKTIRNSGNLENNLQESTNNLMQDNLKIHQNLATNTINTYSNNSFINSETKNLNS